MNASLDHLVYGTPDLARTRDELERTWGVELAAGGSHEGLGTANALISFGDGSYFELMGPDPDQAVPPAILGIAALDTPRLETFVVQVHDIDEAVAALRATGHDPGQPVAMRRLLPDGGVLEWRIALPPAVTDNGTVPALIDWGDSPHPSDTLPGGVSLDSFSVSHPEPGHLLAIYSAIGLELDVWEGPAGLAATITTPNGRVSLG